MHTTQLATMLGAQGLVACLGASSGSLCCYAAVNSNGMQAQPGIAPWLFCPFNSLRPHSGFISLAMSLNQEQHVHCFSKPARTLAASRQHPGSCQHNTGWIE